MCGRPSVVRREQHSEPRVFDGETVKLDARVAEAAFARAEQPHWSKSHSWRGMPFPPWLFFWGWWLIWPLFGLLKLGFLGLSAAFAGLYTFLTRPLVLEISLLPLLLIGLGIVLLLRRR